MEAGLPAGQLSFLLKAGSDTLPTPESEKIQLCCKGCNADSTLLEYTCMESIQEMLITYNIKKKKDSVVIDFLTTFRSPYKLAILEL